MKLQASHHGRDGRHQAPPAVQTWSYRLDKAASYDSNLGNAELVHRFHETASVYRTKRRFVLGNLEAALSEEPRPGQTAGALYQTFPADEARRVLRRLEFHYVPKHASWLNMVEIEIGVLANQCLDRRIESYTRLVAETAAWEKRPTPNAPASTGCSQPKKPAPKWGALTPSPRSNQTKIKNENLCDEVLVASGKACRPSRAGAPIGDGSANTRPRRASRSPHRRAKE